MGDGRSQTPAATTAMADIAADVAGETAVPVALLGGCLRALVAVAATGRRLPAGSWRPAASAGWRPPPPVCRCLP